MLYMMTVYDDVMLNDIFILFYYVLYVFVRLGKTC